MKTRAGSMDSGTVPAAETVCEIIMRLEQPCRVMAWLMAETGCRLADLQAMRVGEVRADYSGVRIGSETGGRTVPVSHGLGASLRDHLTALREVFEIRWRRRRSGYVRTLMFQEQRLFPAWLVRGQERAEREAVLPARLFVAALQDAALDAGYRGPVHSHTLRLFCADRWLREGNDLQEIHRRLGHRDILTTMLMVQALRPEGLAFIPEPTLSSQVA